MSRADYCPNGKDLARAADLPSKLGERAVGGVAVVVAMASAEAAGTSLCSNLPQVVC
jgi:hypothetical protein